MGSESIAHVAEGKIQLVGQKKHLSLVKAGVEFFFCRHCFSNMAAAFRYLWAITYSLVVAQPIKTQH